MGKVYEAHDPHLKRQVAVKLLSGGTPADVRRFVREAEAQAAQSHPAICPVYEAGEDGGTPYIVMKRIDGAPLDRATRGMPLEGKLELLRRIAEAVHAAHRTGLIHRDLKPGNILVEEGDDGEARPYVLDFGLARSLESGVTARGDALGTPAYMAPEQLRGDGGALDRRTDVYALGATLYHLLAGRPPVSGEGLTLLRAIAEREPAPLRSLGVPRDVEAIVFKCLEKEQDRRYRSARALAEDLRRYLDDTPVEARPISAGYRLIKWARRNMPLVRLSAVFAVVLGAALLWGAWSAWQSRERERLARRFTEQVEEMEALARYSHMAPLHDVRPDREGLRRRMEAIRAEMKGGGRFTRAAGRYALGRGYLALEAPDDAYRELKAAWDAEYREPEVAAALARALSALYRDGLAAAELLRDWETRERRREQLDEKYGEPARTFLIESAALGTPDPYLAVLTLFHGGRFEDALRALGQTERRPWAYELDALEGDIRRSLAIKRHSEDDPAGAMAELGLARAAYERAATVAPSDPAVARAAAPVAALYGAWEVLSGEDLLPVLDRALRSLRRAREAQPEDGRTWLWTARLERLAAQSLRVRVEDPGERSARARSAAERAAVLFAEPSEAYRELGRILWGNAQWLRDRGQDPTAVIAEVIAALDRVRPPFRDYLYFLTLGSAHMTLGDHRMDRGEDAAPSFARAQNAYRAAVKLHGKPFGATNNLGVSLFKMSALASTPAPLAVLREAVHVFEKARKLDPDHVAPPYYLGKSYLRLAQGGNAASGLLDQDHAASAVASYRRALELNPRLVVLHNALGEIHHLQGVNAWEEGQDPEPFFALAREAYDAGIAAAPEHAFFHQNLAWTAYFQGKIRVRTARDAGPYLDEALRHARWALELSRQAGALLCVGSAWRMKAEAAFAGGRDPTLFLRRSEAAFSKVLALNANHAEAHRSLGRLLTLDARFRIRAGGDPDKAFEKAREALDRALKLEPEVAYFHLADARWTLVRHRFSPSETIRARGLESVRKALELRPGWVEASALQKSFEG